MLKYRLIFGTLMAALLLGLLAADDKIASFIGLPAKATCFAVLITLLAIPAQLEMKNLAAQKNITIFTPIAILGSAALALSWYITEITGRDAAFHLNYIVFASAIILAGCFVCQARKFATEGVIANCSATFFSIFYLGFLSSFVLAIRLDYELGGLLMFIFTVKSSDIGAYTAGKLFGKHKFSPRISPGKTWEGMVGAVIFASITAMAFAGGFGIMKLYYAALFGVIFAFAGQLGDLAESMIKRDAALKDSSGTVPGFGGVLDIIDSPLMTAPFAFAYYKVFCGGVLS